MEENLNSVVEEFRAWKEKYKNATPEEQEKMLEERAEKRRREEEERQKRIYEDRKKRFTDKIQSEIRTFRMLLEDTNFAMEVIKSFDGKVLNNRLTNAVKKKLQEGVYPHLSFSYDYALKKNVGTLELEAHDKYGNARNREDIMIILSSDGRVIWSETEVLRYKNNEELVNRIKERKEAIKNYDKIYKEAKKLEAALENYSKLNFHVRDFFKAEYVIGGKYYI